MHIRLRHSKRDPSRQELFLVKPNNHDSHNEAMQTLWDDEQKAQQEFDPVNNPQTPLYVQKRPYMRKPSDFVIDFRDLGHRYTYNITNGVAQWFFQTVHSHYHKRPPPVQLESHQHKFFADELICLDRNTVNNLAAMFSGRNTGWLCDDETGHGHYLIRVYLEPDVNQQNLDELDMKHTMHMVCTNARIADVFSGLCGNKLKDQFSLTQIHRNEDPHSKSNIVLGTSYTYLAAETGDITVKDLGWSVGKDKTM